MAARLRAAILGWLLLLAACGGGTDEQGTTTTYNPPITVASTTTLPARGLSGSGPGLVLLRCGGRLGYWLSVLDPVTGRQSSELHFDPPAETVTPRFGCGPNPPWVMRAAFNAAFDELAVSIKRPDGSTHVGVWGIASKETLDLTPPGEGYGSAVRYYDPLFQPTTGHLWFLSDDKAGQTTLMQLVERQGGAPRSVAPWPTGYRQSPPSSFAFGPKTEWAVSWENGRAPLPNPSARLAAADDWQVLHRDSNTWSKVATGGAQPKCQPQAWLDDRSLLCIDVVGGEIVRLVTYSADYASAEVRPLLPDTTRRTVSLVVSPKRDEFAFVSLQGGLGGVFSVFRQSLAGGEPVKVTDIEGSWLNVLPLEWR